MDINELYEFFLRSRVICTDSRNVEKGSIFFALKGESFNGNKFAEEALKKGCLYAVVDEREYVEDERYILVNDALFTLQELSRLHRKHFEIPVIAITGTNGKTTTKELINKILEKKYNVISAFRNLNNQIGAPLTLLRIRDDTEVVIVEMGANHKGEIAELCELALPTHGLITNIGKAHLEGFGDLKTIIETKTELYDYLCKNKGTIFYNRENTILTEQLSGLNCRRLEYGGKSGNYSGVIKNSVPSLEIKIVLNNHIIDVKTNIYGAYNLENILAAVSVGSFFKVDKKSILDVLVRYNLSNNRSQIVKTNSNTLICDAYNANPTSMKLAIDEFELIKDEQKVLILGDMFELGKFEYQEHTELIRYIMNKDLRRVFLIGRAFSSVKELFGFDSFKDVDSFIKWLGNNPINSSYILIKGSRKMELESLIKYL